jgi:hypothetical protein
MNGIATLLKFSPPLAQITLALEFGVQPSWIASSGIDLTDPSKERSAQTRT